MALVIKKLKEILVDTPCLEVNGDTDVEIRDIQIDSRSAGPDSLFVAIKGTQTDGHQYIKQAISNGAKAVLCEHMPESPEEHVTYIRVSETSSAVGQVASVFYDKPTARMKVVGITGTNGKTTTTTLLYQLFSDMGLKTGLLSTVENRIGETVVESTHTTPDPIQLHALLARMYESGCGYVFMEVSSHAIDQNRISGIRFAGAVFTNITHDHLDYHRTFKEYINAKKKFFDNLPSDAFALVNVDDKHHGIMVQNSSAKVYGLSLNTLSDFKAKILENSIHGLLLQVDGTEMYSRLAGEFNAYNLLTAYATAILLGFEKVSVLSTLSNLKGAKGRFETIYAPDRSITGIVDYAHTPDALEKVLLTIAKTKSKGSKIITVVGCGGNRDKTKRPQMARIAAALSDEVILTSDNPRNEEPNDILQEMITGIEDKSGLQKTTVNADRKEAIRMAVKLAKKGDIILVAGKGHETYQEIKGVKYPFDDHKILEETLISLNEAKK